MEIRWPSYGRRNTDKSGAPGREEGDRAGPFSWRLDLRSRSPIFPGLYLDWS